MKLRQLNDINELIKDYISHDFKGFISNRTVAKVLGLGGNQWATARQRNSYPFDELLHFCRNNNLDVFDFLYERDH